MTSGATGSRPLRLNELVWGAAIFAAAFALGTAYIVQARASGTVHTPYDHDPRTPVILFGLALGAVAFLAYAICRVVSARTVAVFCALAFVTSPLQMYALASLTRDYMKTLFVLSALLMLAFLRRAISNERRLVAIGAIAGLVLGVGLYFRQEMRSDSRYAATSSHVTGTIAKT